MKTTSLFPWRTTAAAVVWALTLAGGARAYEFTMTYAIAEIPGLVPGTSTAILVADTGSNGFAGIDALDFDLGDIDLAGATGSIFGDDDLILAKATANNFHDILTGTGVVGFDFATFKVSTSDAALNAPGAIALGLGDGLGENQPLAVYWFPEGTNDSGDPYGFYRDESGTPDVRYGATAGYSTPGDGSTITVVTVTDTVNLGPGVGRISVNDLTLNQGVIVPEPASALLALLALGGLGLRRRRR